ncbi:hypothetical protein SAMN05444920_116210 [Nonomuraea solani]|uniref:Nucleotidyl transferase AbiEii toxin, Type IV TA system n=1 Tax=Nonomuraea solani TaxID=1144553 RepID=A0A1H6EU53_9ACTN|nr:hypothetical protein [Nonomuraea solani]SEH00475.1 hypothetical protein SAMN05444920_116210 [Nonomuraea solani]
MGDGKASLLLEDVTSALETTLTAMKAVGADPMYRVGGTGAALLQGVHLPVGDLDVLLARREDVDTISAALSSFPCLYPASWLPETSQYFARYEVNGVPLELSTVEQETDSDAMECIGRGPWQHYVLITCGPHQVPVVRLELRLATELLRDRPDRYEPLLDLMAAQGYEPDLLKRAMATHDLPMERRRLVNDRLNPGASSRTP